MGDLTEPSEDESAMKIKKVLHVLHKQRAKLSNTKCGIKKTYFTNISKQPLNRIHLEKATMVLKKALLKDMDEIDAGNADATVYFQRHVEVLPALHKAWIYPEETYSEFQPFLFEFSKEENTAFIPKNADFVYQLHLLLAHNYHKFWCYVLYEPRLVTNIINFLQKPVFLYELEYLTREQMRMYLSVYNKVYKIYCRLLKFRQSDIEYMEEETVLQYLEEKGLLGVQIVINLATLYGERNPKMAYNLFTYCCSPRRKFNFVLGIAKHIKSSLVILEMIGGHVCGFEDGAKIIPVELDPKPINLSPQWYIKAINYIMNTISSLHTVFSYYKESISIAIQNGLPYRMSYFYDHVFPEIHRILNQKWPFEPEKCVWMRERIYSHIFKCRAKFIQTFDIMVTYSIDKILYYVGDSSNQNTSVEQYLKLLTSAMEDELFFADYNAEGHIAAQIQNIRELCPEIDQTRTDFILQCVSNLEKRGPLWKQNRETQTALTAINLLKTSPENIRVEKNVLVLEKTVAAYSDLLNWDCIPKDIADNAKAAIAAIPEEQIRRYQIGDGNGLISVKPEKFSGDQKRQPAEKKKNGVSEESIEEAIASVSNMLPHLGDGFILKCLEYYNYNATDVISAILDENLAPHLMEIPINEIRIPPEPAPPQPIRKHIGKKPFEYRDAKDLLNDKSALTNEIRESIKNNYLYDDDYDDGLDEMNTKIDYSNLGVDNSETYKATDENSPSGEESSSGEHDDNDSKKVNKSAKVRDAFCEDPAVLREKRERQRRQMQTPRNDVRGKPKGQGQDKNVVVNRDKKNVNKATRANHNRKGGAQWKRSKGMMPS